MLTVIGSLSVLRLQNIKYNYVYCYLYYDFVQTLDISSTVLKLHFKNQMQERLEKSQEELIEVQVCWSNVHSLVFVDFP